MKTALRLLLGICLLGFVGCGGPATIRNHELYSQHNRYSVDDVVREMTDHACQQLTAREVKGNVAFMQCYHSGGVPTTLEERINVVAIAGMTACAAGASTSFRILEPSAVQAIMTTKELTAVPINIVSRASDWHKLGARVVGTCHWEQAPEDKVKIVLDFIDVANGGKYLISVERTIPKDDELRRLMGERLPGMVTVISPSDGARVYVDGMYRGTIENEPVSFEVPFGTHSLRVDKSGYTSFLKGISVGERDTKRFRVKFTQSHTAPVTATLLSAVLPSSAALIYGPKLGPRNAAVAFNGSFAVLFYAAGIAWVVDDRAPDRFMTAEDRKTYNTIKDVELYSAIGAYAVNVISGWFVGNEYRKVSKRGVEYSARAEPPRVYVRAEHSPNLGPLLRLDFIF